MSKIKYLVILQTSEGEKESDQSTQSLDLGFPDDDDEPPQQEGETNYRSIPSRRSVTSIYTSFNVINLITSLNAVANHVNNTKGIVDLLCRYET